MDAHVHAASHPLRKSFRLPFWLGCIAFVGIGLFFLLSEHRAHTLGALPYLLLLLCPVLHFLMHRGHQHPQVDQRETKDPSGGRP